MAVVADFLGRFSALNFSQNEVVDFISKVAAFFQPGFISGFALPCPLGILFRRKPI